MGVRHWNETIDGPFSEAALRRKLETAGYVIARYTYPPGMNVPDRVHQVDRIDAVISGRFRMVVAGHLAVLGPGDWVEVPRGVRHSATVLGVDPVTGLDAMRRGE
jgi:mannose-6-phosphate isomerase-like protein (cupin superfamily)